MAANRRRAKIIARLRARIPTDFECELGCTDCCKNHAWSCHEWQGVEPKLMAAYQQQKCPYALPAGCACYEERPMICRLFGIGGVIHCYGHDFDFKCPRGLKPPTPLPDHELRDIFCQWMDIIHDEARDMMNEGHEPRYAGPYGAFVPRRQTNA